MSLLYYWFDDFLNSLYIDRFTIRLAEVLDNWLRAARIKERAHQGDKEAAAELESMESTPLEPVEDKGFS